MEIILQKSKVDAFVTEMENLGKKFNDRQLSGKIEDFVKLDCVDGMVDLKFVKPVPEMVRIACYMVFVQTLL